MTSSLPVRFCATGKRGLGHLRRVTNIARAMRARDYRNLQLYTNADVAGLSAAEVELYSQIVVSPRSSFVEAMSANGDGPVIVDTANVEGLGSVDAPLALVLRETVDSRVHRFRLDSGRLWDQVLLPNPASHWTVSPADVGAERVDAVGWIYRQSVERPPRVGGDAHKCKRVPRVLIASGGGGHVQADYRRSLGSILQHLRAATDDAVHVVAAKGPRSSSVRNIGGIDEYRDFGSDLPLAFAAADVVISTAGYNSVMELATTTTPALLLSVETTYDDQQARARRWGDDLGHCHCSVVQSCAWLADVLGERRRRPAVYLGASGAERAVDHLESLFQ